MCLRLMIMPSTDVVPCSSFLFPKILNELVDRPSIFAIFLLRICRILWKFRKAVPSSNVITWNMCVFNKRHGFFISSMPCESLIIPITIINIQNNLLSPGQCRFNLYFFSKYSLGFFIIAEPSFT